MSAFIHMVTFTLHAGKDNEAADAFLQKSQELLRDIPGVQDFKVLRQVSAKNDHDYGFSMNFVNREAFEAYNVHPVHAQYVAEIWESQVSSFQETDLIAYP
ncbi:stress responsive protein [Saccharibacillus sp. O16]|nr:stress responsive protein [Saccharibacillus sp. O16]